jgi:hypothetical protein
MPSSLITSQMASRMAGSPCPALYCIARRPSAITNSCRIEPTTSSGRSVMFGMPPARDTTSGRLATANKARIAEAVIWCVRAAYRST